MKKRVINGLAAATLSTALFCTSFNVSAQESTVSADVPFALKTSDNSYVSGADLEVVNLETNESSKWQSEDKDKSITLSPGAYSYKITNLPKDYTSKQMELNFYVLEDGTVVTLTEEEQSVLDAAKVAEAKIDEDRKALSKKTEDLEVIQDKLNTSTEVLKKTFTDLKNSLLGESGIIKGMRYDDSVYNRVENTLSSVDLGAPYNELTKQITDAIKKIKDDVPVFKDLYADEEAVSNEAESQIADLEQQKNEGLISEDEYNDQVFTIEYNAADTIQTRELGRKATFGSFAENEGAITRVNRDAEIYNQEYSEYSEAKKVVDDEESQINRKKQIIQSNTLAGTVVLTANKKVVSDKKESTSTKAGSVSTGNDNDMKTYIAFATMSLLGLFYLLLKRKNSLQR